MHALVVEDEPIFRLDLVHRLRSLGFDEIHGTAYAEEAIEYVRLRTPDLILMDVRLKGEKTGIEAAQEIGLDHRIPILVMSAYHFEHDDLRTTVPGFLGYLAKPIDDYALRRYCEQLAQS